MELSIIIPSLRNRFFNQCVNAIKKTIGDVEYEILENHEVGCLYEIINKEYRWAKGKYVMLTCDDAIVSSSNWARDMINLLEDKPLLTLGNFSCVSDNRGTIRPIDVRYYGKLCAIHPFFKREAVQGDLLDLRFKRFYGDIDLSMRFYAHGGSVVTCPTALITMFSNRDRIKKEAIASHFNNDDLEFKKKWGNYDFSLCSNSEASGALQTLV